MPANATALITVPATGGASSVREGSAAAGRSPGVVVQSVADGHALLSVGSGDYRFTAS